MIFGFICADTKYIQLWHNDIVRMQDLCTEYLHFELEN